MKYEDFLDLEYKPVEKDLVCLFKITPSRELPIEKVAIRVAAESSNGTWTALKIPEHIKALSAKVYQINGSYVKIAYPNDLFEEPVGAEKAQKLDETDLMDKVYDNKEIAIYLNNN